MPEIHPCSCGKPALLYYNADRKSVSVCCSVNFCWMGPERETEEEAIAAWSVVHSAAEVKGGV